MTPSGPTDTGLRVLFDGTGAGTVGGVARWTLNVVPALAAKAQEWSITVAADRGQALSLPPLSNLEVTRPWRSSRFRRALAMAGWNRYPRSRESAPDALVGPAFVTWRGGGIPEIPVVHDLAFLRHPRSVSPRNLVYLRAAVPRSIARASVVATVSEAMRAEISDEYRLDPDRVVVVPGAARLPPPTGRLPAGIREPFLLWVGTLEPRKNPKAAIAALRIAVADRVKSLSLVLVGMNGWRSGSLGVDLDRELKSANVVWLTSVDDGMLATLYSRAEALIFPSFYEGFGLPILEAMTLGCPVVASDIAVAREVAGDTAFFVDPHDHSSVAHGVALALEQGKDEARIRAQMSRAERFSWERSARALRAAIEVAIAG
jgi:glycosyltransferase involved in cell wall biosynthesis